MQTGPEIAEEIEARAKAAGITLDELCRRANVARSALWRWKSGETSPTWRSLSKINKVLAESSAPAAEAGS